MSKSEQRKAYLRGRLDVMRGRGLYYSGRFTPDYLRGAHEAKKNA